MSGSYQSYTDVHFNKIIFEKKQLMSLQCHTKTKLDIWLGNVWYYQAFQFQSSTESSIHNTQKNQRCSLLCLQAQHPQSLN